MDNLISAVKLAAMDAIENNKPVGVYYGTVKNSSPLIITINDIDYDLDFLVLSRNVTDFTINLTQNGSVGDSPNGSIKYIVHNSLKTGDKVIVVREQGGQKYIVIDRVV